MFILTCSQVRPTHQ